MKINWNFISPVQTKDHHVRTTLIRTVSFCSNFREPILNDINIYRFRVVGRDCDVKDVGSVFWWRKDSGGGIISSASVIKNCWEDQNPRTPVMVTTCYTCCKCNWCISFLRWFCKIVKLLLADMILHITDLTWQPDKNQISNKSRTDNNM